MKLRRFITHASLSVLLALAAGCTTVGVHTRERTRVDYGAPATLRVCLLVNDGVTPERATALIAAVNKEFEPYRISVVVPWIRPWSRPGFKVGSIIAELTSHPLEPPCDRLVGLVNRNAGDFLWGLLLPEVLGAVDENTHTHGYVVANYGSVDQVFEHPDEAAVHEFYHLLGCGHGVALTACYHEIADIKAQIGRADDLFPGLDGAGHYLLSREAVNEMLRAEHSTLVRICVNEQGTLSQPPALQRSSGDKRLDAAALELAGKGRYAASMENGRPVAGCRTLGLRLDRQGKAASDQETSAGDAPP